MKRLVRFFWLSSFALFIFVNSISAASVLRTAAGANAAAIQSAVDQFRADLGGVNNGAGGSFTTGRREINWDGVPDNFASPNNFPLDFFNVNSPRGIVFDGSSGNFIRVSADSSNPTSTPVRFGEIDPSYTNNFSTFSSERLFGAFSNVNQSTAPQFIDIVFFIPGTTIPATVSGFGAVFTDVDLIGSTSIVCYGPDGKRLTGCSFAVPVANNGVSFLGVSFNAGERISRIRINSGVRILAPGNVDSGATLDMVAMDDLIYGEPRAAQYHANDFDGDGVSDATIFRPSTGNWFVLQSGSNTVKVDQFGSNGDVPINGDFDGDQLADTAIYRPANGQWWFKRSSNGTVLAATLGQSGDKPVPGDYDKDGKTDFAVWRPSDGNWFIIRSSDNFSSFFGFPFGQSGDVPSGAAVNP